MIQQFRSFLRQTPSWVVLVKLFIGLGWIRAGVEKAISLDWWSGAELRAFISEHSTATLGWYEPFLDLIVSPAAPAVALVVMVAQFLIGGALLTGRKVGLALGAGIFLNLHFIAAGAVTPAVFYILSQGAVALWMAEHSERIETRRLLEVTGVSSAMLALAHLPWVRTIAPADVIHDPAIMLATAGLMSALGCVLARERLLGSQEPVALTHTSTSS